MSVTVYVDGQIVADDELDKIEIRSKEVKRILVEKIRLNPKKLKKEA